MIGTGHGSGLPEDQHILKIQRVVPENELEVVAQAQSQNDGSIQQKGQPRPAEDPIQEKQDHYRRQNIHGQQEAGLEISQEHAPGIAAVGKNQGQGAQAGSRAQQDKKPPEIVCQFFPYRPFSLRFPPEKKDLVQQRIQRITSLKIPENEKRRERMIHPLPRIIDVFCHQGNTKGLTNIYFSFNIPLKLSGFQAINRPASPAANSSAPR